jgi:uncharacterized hydantoinase/oxoprolinase family protein
MRSLLIISFIIFSAEIFAEETTFQQLKKTADAYISEHENPDRKSLAQFISQTEVDNQFCQTCPGYINLSLDVSKILDRISKGDSIESANTAVLESNRLKFLFYTLKNEMSDGTINCSKCSK